MVPQKQTPERNIMDAKNIDTSNLRPVCIRHRYSGVWVGYIQGPGTYEGLITLVGRRVWGWRGGRLELSQLAKKGLRAEDRLGEWEVVEINMADGAIELRTVERSMVEDAKRLAADGEAG